MSTESEDSGDRKGTPVDISLSLGEHEEVWIARDEETGIVSQGSTRQAALENLDEAVAGYYGAGEAPTDEQLRETGVDPDQNSSKSLDDSEIFE